MKHLARLTALLLAAVSPLVADITAEIKTKAAQEWPDDYAMQKFVINREIEALKKMGAYIKKYEKSAPIHRILINSVKDWPNDYAMQVFVFERQLKAYREIHQ